jgi:hypothetical protein
MSFVTEIKCRIVRVAAGRDIELLCRMPFWRAPTRAWRPSNYNRKPFYALGFCEKAILHNVPPCWTPRPTYSPRDRDAGLSYTDITGLPPCAFKATRRLRFVNISLPSFEKPSLTTSVYGAA